MGLNIRHEFITYHIINKSGILSILYDIRVLCASGTCLASTKA